LSQNYPNPFSQITAITYTIPGQTDVSIDVFDISGKKVLTLVEQERKDRGRYIVEFNAESIPSGMYYYRMRAGNYANVRKMILLK
jgi:hypothetical protein